MPTTTVASVQVNEGTAQRSEVRSITVTFSDPVIFSGGESNSAAAFQLRRVSDGQYVNLASTVSPMRKDRQS